MSGRTPRGVPLGVLGFTLRAAEASDAVDVWEYAVDPAHFNPNGVLHGGVVMALLDTAMGAAVAAVVEPSGRFNAAAQLNVHFLAPVKAGRLRARATIKKMGKRLAFVESEATDDDGHDVAIATSTHALLP